MLFEDNNVRVDSGLEAMPHCKRLQVDVQTAARFACYRCGRHGAGLMYLKTHGLVLFLFLIAGICYASQFVGAAVSVAILGAVIEFGAWITWAISNRKNIR